MDTDGLEIGVFFLQLLLCKLCGNGGSSSSHKADKAKPHRALLQSIENVLEHTLAGVSKID